jgi:hypothetical protein
MTTEPIITGPIIIRHRVNTISELSKVSSHHGIEFDIREGKDGIVVTHDPWSESVEFEEFLLHVNHAFYIVNVKSEGIEHEALRLLAKYNIGNFFLLDCSIPMIVKLSKQGIHKSAIRVSEYESIQNAINFKPQEWIWLDSFHSLPMIDICLELKKHGFRICLVAPELQGRVESPFYLKHYIDAVCTKYPENW